MVGELGYCAKILTSTDIELVSSSLQTAWCQPPQTALFCAGINRISSLQTPRDAQSSSMSVLVEIFALRPHRVSGRRFLQDLLGEQQQVGGPWWHGGR